MDGQGAAAKQFTPCSAFMAADSMTEWYVGTMEDFWSGNWDGSDSAFIFFGVSCTLLFCVPLFWSDIVFWVDFAWDVVRQPIYGGALLLFILRMRRRKRKKGGGAADPPL